MLSPQAARARLVALDRFEAKQSLSNFVALAWAEIEPAMPYVGGWAVDAICEHLEAVTYGWVNRLLINVPPGSAKSLLSSVFWPAWEWGPMDRPSTRYLATSFNEGPVKRDTRKMRDLVMSPWYQERWPRIRLVRTGETSFANSLTGTREGVPFPSLTSQRGDRLICFPGDQLVRTEKGLLPISVLVESRSRLRVWSTDVRTGKTSLKRVTGWHRNPASALVEVGLSDGATFRCTPDHRVWTLQGWRHAVQLGLCDRLPVFTLPNLLNGSPANAKLSGQRGYGFPTGVGSQGLCLGQLGPGRQGAAPAIPPVPVPGGGLYPSASLAHALNGPLGYAVTHSQYLGVLLAIRNLSRLLLGQLRAGPLLVQGQATVAPGVPHVFQARAVAQVVQAAVGGIAVQVTDFVACWWGTYKRLHHALVHLEHSVHVVGVEPWVAALTGGPARQQPLPHGPAHAVAHDGVRPSLSSDPTKVADAVVPFQSGYRSPLFVRYGGHAQVTYCLTVEDNHTFYVGGGNSVLVANCDDLHSTTTAESDTERRKTVRQFREGAVNRLNDQLRSAIIVIMQRLHEGDVAGEILSGGMGYAHLCLPMRFDPEPYRVSGYTFDPIVPNAIGFKDPRTEPGELLNPGRFSAAVVDQLEHDVQTFAFAGQYQQRPVPREGGIFKRHWFDGHTVRAAPPGTVWVRHWDLAATRGKGAYSAGVLLGRTPEGRYVLGHVERCQEEGDVVRKRVRLRGEMDIAAGRSATIGIPQDGGQAGKVQRQEMVAFLAGFTVRVLIEASLGDKQRRAEPFAVQCEAGNVSILLTGDPEQDAWVEPYLSELCLFPGGKYKDQVDATSGAFAALVTAAPQAVVGTQTRR